MKNTRVFPVKRLIRIVYAVMIIVMLAIIGLTIFELIFEARARYLYTYVPLYIILAAAGVQKIVEKKNNLHWL